MEQPVLDQATVKRNRMMVMGIMLIPLLVMAAATGLWWATESGKLDLLGSIGTHNEGTLLSPVRPIAEIDLYTAGDEPFVYADQAPKWSLLIPGSASCDEACREQLWFSRQLQTAMGRRAAYMRRYYLSDAWPLDAEFASYLAAEHPRMEVLYTSPASRDRLLGGLPDGREAVADGLYFLVDKQGYVMMVYGPEHSGKQVQTDLKFLMKQSGDD